MTIEQMKVREFHLATGLPARDRPALDPASDALRVDLIWEELRELSEAQDECSLVKMADALGDLLYVVYGAAVTYGIDLKPVFDEIHRSNMTKVKGGVIRREDGKILKGPHYTPPDLVPIIAAQVVRKP